MFYDEEQLPLYIKNTNNRIINVSLNKSQNSSSSPKQNNNKIKSKNIIKSKENPDKKKLMKIEEQENKFIKYINNFFILLFNNKNKKIILFFLILNIVAYIEYFIDKFIDNLAIKFAVFILFSIPYLILILDNEPFFHLNSYFEFNFLIFLKLVIFFSKKMNFFELFIFTLNANLFKSIYVKKIHLKQYFYILDGYLDKITYKIYIFESEIFFIISGIIINIISLALLLKNEKFSFYLFDEILKGLGENYMSDYFFIFEYLFLRKFIKNFIKYIFIHDYKYKNKDKSTIIYISFILFILFQIIAMKFLFNSFIEILSKIFYLFLIIFIYENIGFIFFLTLIILSFIILFVNNYMQNHLSQEMIVLLNNNLNYVNISFLFSLTLFISIFILEKKQISNFYIKIHQRIFLIKVIFDIWLIIKYIYCLYKYNHIDYYNIFIKTYKLFFSFFVINYILVLIFVLIKIFIHINPNDINYCFEEIVIFLNNKKNKNELFYGGDSPYFEIKLYKKCKKLSNFLKEDLSNDNKKMKAFQKILYSVIVIILFFLALIINNCMIYFIVFFVFLQFCSDFLNDIIFLILNNLSLVIYLLKESEQNLKYKKYKEDYIIQKYNKKIMKQRAFSNIKTLKKEKFKLVYILAFFHVYLFIKKIFSRFYIFIYENYISLIQYKLFGKLEPLCNIIYQFFIMNFYQEKFNKNILKENIFLYLFLLPNSLALIYSHYQCKKINFFFQNFILTNLLPYFFKLDFAISFLGFLNIFVMINLFAADSTTYKNYKFWFFLFGIQSMNFKF